MTTPTQAQIEAAAKAISDVFNKGGVVWHSALADAALTAAAEVECDWENDAKFLERELERVKLRCHIEKAATIERCAQVAEGFSQRTQSTAWEWAAREIAAAIRKLKDEA